MRNDVMGHKRSFRLLISRRTIFAWQCNDELGELTELGFNIDPATHLPWDTDERPFPAEIYLTALLPIVVRPPLRKGEYLRMRLLSECDNFHKL